MRTFFFMAAILATASVASAQMSADDALAALKQREAAASTQPDVDDLRQTIEAMREKNAQLEKQLADALATIKRLQSQLARIPSAANTAPPVASVESIKLGMSEDDLIAFAKANSGGVHVDSTSDAGGVVSKQIYVWWNVDNGNKNAMGHPVLDLLARDVTVTDGKVTDIADNGVR